MRTVVVFFIFIVIHTASFSLQSIKRNKKFLLLEELQNSELEHQRVIVYSPCNSREKGGYLDKQNNMESKEDMSETRGAIIDESFNNTSYFAQEMASLTTFDELTNWGQIMGEKKLVALLLSRKILMANRSEPLPVLATLLADSILTERQNTMLLKEATEITRPELVGHWHHSQDISRFVNKKKQNNNFDSTHSTSTNKRSFKNRDSLQERRNSSAAINDSFFVERDLLSWLTNGVLFAQDKLLGNLLRVVQFGTQPIHFQPLQICEKGATRALSGVLSAVLSIGVELLNQSACWAGGGLLPPSHVLLISGTYAVQARAGLKGWLAALAVVRLMSVTIRMSPTNSATHTLREA